MDVKNKEYLARGKRGVAYTATLNGKNVLLKVPNPKASINTISKEAEILQRVNKKGIGPTFIQLTDEGLVMEYVDGVVILDWAANATRAEIINMLVDILHQCRELDRLGISKQEMTRPYKHILVVENKPVQIDFERAVKTTKPQNVTQLCQWIVRSKMAELLQKKNIVMEKTELLALAKAYKNSYSQRDYNRIVRVIRGF